jgi:hypothetical protein
MRRHRNPLSIMFLGRNHCRLFIVLDLLDLNVQRLDHARRAVRPVAELAEQELEAFWAGLEVPANCILDLEATFLLVEFAFKDVLYEMFVRWSKY